MKKVQGKAAKVIKGMKWLPNEKQLNRLGPFRMGNRKIRIEREAQKMECGTKTVSRK